MTTLFAQTTAPAAAQGPSVTYQMVFFGLAMVGMYFLLIAPQRKKQKEMDALVAALKTGDDVVTSGGIFGTITNVKDDRFVVRIAEGTKIEVAKSAITTVLKKAGAEEKKSS
jgi:preprotein translocase subunit YajC